MLASQMLLENSPSKSSAVASQKSSPVDPLTKKIHFTGHLSTSLHPSEVSEYSALLLIGSTFDFMHLTQQGSI
jgi:hypothetical protein